MKEKDTLMKPQKKITTCLIEKVSNGFIVVDDFYGHPGNPVAIGTDDKKVFNTKKQLNNYLNKSFE